MFPLTQSDYKASGETRGEGGRSPGRQPLGGGKNGDDKGSSGILRLSGAAKLQSPLAPITHATPLYKAVAISNRISSYYQISGQFTTPHKALYAE